LLERGEEKVCVVSCKDVKLDDGKEEERSGYDCEMNLGKYAVNTIASFSFERSSLL
jgi:hypothetical protein